MRRGFGDNLVSVVLFGSVARGDFDPATADLDFLVVCKTLPPDRGERYRLFDRALEDLAPLIERLAEQHCHVQFSPVLKTKEEAVHRSPLYLDMVHDARILYDRGGFFSNILRGLRKRLRTLGARRVFLQDGGWYWDLKPDYKFGEIVEI